MTAPARLIAVESVSKRYVTSSGPVEALHDVSLTVGEGEFCTLIGPSGCGKSTLLGMLGGLVQPDSGRVLVDARPVTAQDLRGQIWILGPHPHPHELRAGDLIDRHVLVEERRSRRASRIGGPQFVDHALGQRAILHERPK